MGVSFRGVLALAALGASGLAALPASATTYTDSFAISPGSLACSSFGDTDICNFSVPVNSLVVLNAGDVLDLTVTYSSPLFVPGSKTSNLAYIGVVDNLYPGGPAGSGPIVASYASTVQGYVGPANPILGPFSDASVHSYFGVTGFCCGVGGPNAGFSLTQLQSTITILAGDPTPLASVDFGYQVNVPEPASWALMLVGFVGLGGALRARRRVGAAA